MAKKYANLPKDDQDVLNRYEEFIQDTGVISDIHDAYRQDKKFVELDMQWEAAALAQRNSEVTPRPSLTINLCRQFAIQVANDAAQKRVGGKVIPTGESSEKVANVFEGLIRAIQRNSNADAAYDHALQDAVNGGFGAFRIVPEYESDDSFDQKLTIKRIMDATSVRWSQSVEPDFSDCMSMSFSESMDKKTFIAEFGKDALRFYTAGSNPDQNAWGNKDKPVVTEFWYVLLIKQTLYQLVEVDENGIPKTCWADELVSAGGDVPDEAIATDEEGEPISRESNRRSVKWCKLAGGKVLKKVDWPGYNIPIYIVAGREVVVDSIHRFVSMIRPMKDSQRVYNYSRSSQLERISLAPKNPWLVPEDAITPQNKRMWDTANSRNWNALKYRQYDEQGRQLNKPERSAPINTDPALTEEAQTSAKELNAVTGRYDPSQGKAQGDQSGKAIMALQDQGDTSTFDFINNRNTAIIRAMWDLIDLIPYYYDTPRQIMIINADDTQELITINTKAQDKNGNETHYDLTAGKYKMAIDVGPDRKTRLLQTADATASLIQAVPQAGMVRPDLTFKALAQANGLDPTITGEIVESLRETLPPEVKAILKGADGKEQKQPPIPPQVIQALQQADQEEAAMRDQIGQLTQQNQELTEANDIKWFEAKTKRIDVLMKNGVAQHKAEIQADTDVELAHIAAASEHAKTLGQMAAQPSPNGDATSQEVEQEGSTMPQNGA